jgi:hypothetical protein
VLRPSVCLLVNTFDDCSNLVSKENRAKKDGGPQITFFGGWNFLDSFNALKEHRVMERQVDERGRQSGSGPALYSQRENT